MPNLPAKPDDDLLVGLEDFDLKTDMQMPRLRLDHQEGVLVDTLSGATYETIEGAILLGLIKQRTMWPPDVGEEKTGPLCRSLNFTQGNPDHDRFPWKASGFKPADYPEGEQLPCEGCQLKEWGTHPKNETAWCAEQFTIALMIPAGRGTAPALLTLQRSGLKSARAYMTSFVREQRPMFTAYTNISLLQLKRGTVKYVVPQFTMGGNTDESLYPDFADQTRRIKAFVQSPRSESAGDRESTSEATPTAKTAASTDDDDKIDW